ncbi:ribosome biogenesis protein NOP53 [Chelonus insularis]|uniref:ribosome biogenesis protein NOP53 n=1 Tax=Chelonus insularis TaxID=460826 RepID=UPI00158A375A|nr:ribosome biogenesis protein NOP53 [Chelonus insularis]
MVQIKIIDSENSVKKKKKVSKKTKKSWRKHVNIKDVDDFLEDKRLEERLGIPFAKRSDKELFAIDTTPDLHLIDEDHKKSKAAYRLALKNSEPRCYAILKPSSAVPDPIVKRNRVKTPEERKNPITKHIEKIRKLNGQLKLKEKIALKNRKLAEERKKNQPKRGEYNLDIWNVQPTEEVEIKTKIDSQWLTSETLKHTLAIKGVKKRNIPKTIHTKPSILPAVEPPHPGTSYNPSYEDHQSLLHEVAEKEIKLMKQEAHLDRVTTKMFKKVSPEENTKNRLRELSEGLPSTEGSTSVNDQDLEKNEDPNKLSINPPVKNKKKTLVQRRKIREQNALASEQKQKKLEKKKISDIYRVKILNKKIANREQKSELLSKKKEKLKALKAKETKVLSKNKFEAPDPDFQLGEELSGNLRNTQPAKSLLTDRFKSLQQRNIVAPSTRVLKLNKPKVKRYIKPDHKIQLPKTSK